MIEFESVTFSYPGAKQPAIRELNLHIGQGERVCVLGANGSGKSTFARLVAGLLNASRGTVKVAGSVPGKASTGFLFQNVDNQIVAATVAKDIAFGPENYGIERAEMLDRVQEGLRQFKIQSLASRLTAELSGGEKQRVALASVMVLEPELLILDEPDSYLDVAGRKLLREELANVRSEFSEMTEIRITQYPQIARQYERVMIFDRGSVVADGAPNDVFLDENLLKRTSLLTADLEIDKSDGWDFSRGPHKLDSISALVCDKVSFGYENDELLRKLSFRLESGACMGLVGASGTGKSTMLQLLCNILVPDSGHVYFVDDQNKPAKKSVSSHVISAVLQRPERQFFLPTCAEEIRFGPSNRGEALSSNEINALLELVGLDRSMARRDPYTLSGGEQRRLAFATILSLRPSFIVFDEPTCGLDRDGVARFLALSRVLTDSGVGQVIISHDGDVIKRLTERVLVLESGGGYRTLATDDFFASGDASGIVDLPEDHRSSH